MSKDPTAGEHSRAVVESGFHSEGAYAPATINDTLSPVLVRPAPPDPVVQDMQEARGLSRWGLWLALLGLAPVLAWMALAPLNSAVVAPGHVKVDLNRRTLQHAEGGLVREVLVRDGEEVKAGQPLLTLGDVAVSANRQRLSYRLWSEKAGILRLDAELTGHASLDWPPELLQAAESDPDLADQLRKEQLLFSTRREALRSQLGLMAAQKTRIGAEMQSLRLQMDRVKESLAAQEREFETANALTKEGYFAATRLSQMEASVADYKGRIEERRGEAVRGEQRVGDINLKMRSMQDEYRQAASDGMKVARVRLQEVEQELAKAADASTRQAINAPVAGVVMGLRFTSAGGVLAPREPIADIVPANPRLLVEARIRTEDVARVHVGQEASLRFTAFKYRTSRPVPARISYLSADRQVDAQTGVPYYLIQAEVTEARAPGAVEAGEKLQAGMPADVYIEGGSRTPLQYLLEPVTQVLLKAGRER